MLMVETRNKKEPRFEGYRTMWRRIRDNPNSWSNIQKLGANESLGSQLGLLYAEREITERLADAGRYFAMLAGKYDRYHSVSKRVLGSPAYENGYGGRTDEVARAERAGTLAEYERKAKKIKRHWRRACEVLGNDMPDDEFVIKANYQRRLFDLMEAVCIRDEHCPFQDIPAFRSGLEMLARKFGFTEDLGHRSVFTGKRQKRK